MLLLIYAISTIVVSKFFALIFLASFFIFDFVADLLLLLVFLTFDDSSFSCRWFVYSLVSSFYSISGCLFASSRSYAPDIFLCVLDSESRLSR